MRRICLILAPTALLIAFGCSGRYEKRLEKTMDRLKYAHRLDQNLQPAPTEGVLKDRGIYIRPPKPMVAAKTFALEGAVTPGLFDVEKTFDEGAKSQLHVIARIKAAKKAPAKGAKLDETPAVARGQFNTDVLTALKGVYGENDNLAIEKLRDDPHGKNPFKRLLVTAEGKAIQIYFSKVDPYDVALIFAGTPAEISAISSKILLTLESFAVGNLAQSKYNTGGSEEEAAEAGAAPGVPF